MSKFSVQGQQLGRVTQAIVKDQAGRSLFLLVGRWGTRGDVFSLYATSGEILVSIRQASWTFDTRFELHQRFEKVGTPRELFNPNADFYYAQGFHWVVAGDIKVHWYSIYQIHKEIMLMGGTTLCADDYFVLTVANGEGTSLHICIAVVLGYWLYNRKKQETSDDFGLDSDLLTDQ